MKKLLQLSLLLGLLSNSASAQKFITLTKDNIPFSGDSVHNYAASLTGFVVPKTDTNHAWNYAALIQVRHADTGHVLNPFKAFTNSGTAIADTGRTEKLTSANNVKVQYIYDKDTNGIFFAGAYVKAQNYSLANYFGVSTDNLNIPAQSDYSRVEIIHFPSTFKSGHKSNPVRKLNFDITVSSVGYNKKPGVKKTYYFVSDSIVGWGAMRLPASNKFSIYYKVLLQRKKTMTIDSIFIKANDTVSIDKQPANPIFLNALGIKQAVKAISYKEFFYREGYQAPMMSIDFGTDSTYKTPVSVIYHADSLQSAVPFANKTIENFSIFPNPATGSLINCRFNKLNPQPWSLVVMNSLGQVIYTQPVTGFGEMNLQVETTWLKSSGICFVNIVNENREILSNSKVEIIK